MFGLKSRVKRFVGGIIAAYVVKSLMGCASVSQPRDQKIVLDTQGGAKDSPVWVKSTKLSWEEERKVVFKSQHTIKGSERINGCFDLAKFDTKETVLTELSEDIKGRMDNAQQSLSEDAELILGKVRSGEYKGRITGLRFTERFYERYKINDAERIDCHVLGEMPKEDYNRLKRGLVSELAAVDPQLKAAITKKQIEFFDNPERVPAKVEEKKEVKKVDTAKTEDKADSEEE